MALKNHDKENFNMLQRAFENADAALLECVDKDSGEYVATICAVHRNGDEYCFTPLAILFQANPFDRIKPR